MTNPLDDLVGQGDHGGWTGLPNSITVPGEASGNTPRIYLGDDDPLADAAGQDAAMVLYFNTESAFTVAVETTGNHNFGQLNIYGLSNDGPNSPVSFIEFDYGTGYLGGAQFANILIGHSGVGDVDFSNNGYVNIANAQNLDVSCGGDVDFNTGADVNIHPAGLINLGDIFDPADVIVDGTMSDTASLSYLKGQKGVVSVSFVALSNTTIAVVFPFPFAAGLIPDVQVNIDSGAGVTARWGARAIGISNTGFTLFVFKMEAAGAAQTWAGINVRWSALTEG